MSRSNSSSTARIHPHWTTRLTRQFPCRLPILGAPMANCAGGALAAAVAAAGGLGFVGAGHALDSEAGLTQLEQEIQLFRAAASSAKEEYPLCLGFIGYSTFRRVDNWKRLELVLQRHRPAVVQFFAPALARAPFDFYNSSKDSQVDSYKRNNVTLCHKYNAQVVAQVGTVHDALEAAVEYGVDALMVQGSEAGGHGLRPQQMGNATLPLAVTVLSQLRAQNNDSTPVVAAGGIADGRTMAAFLAAGCDGVVLGTRLWGARESLGKASFKDRLVAPETTCDRVTRTPIFDWIQNTYSDTPWPEPYDTVGALRNNTTKEWQGREHELKEALLMAGSSSEKKNSNDRNDDGSSSSDEASSLSRIAHDYRQACERGDANVALIHAGQGVGLMDAVEPAADLVTRISLEAEAILRRAPAQLFTTTQEG